jgi:hypothetical protein
MESRAERVVKQLSCRLFEHGQRSPQTGVGSSLSCFLVVEIGDGRGHPWKGFNIFSLGFVLIFWMKMHHDLSRKWRTDSLLDSLGSVLSARKILTVHILSDPFN